LNIVTLGVAPAFSTSCWSYTDYRNGCSVFLLRSSEKAAANYSKQSPCYWLQVAILDRFVCPFEISSDSNLAIDFEIDHPIEQIDLPLPIAPVASYGRAFAG